MKRLPVLPTLIVAAAVAVMIGLGIWQLRRAEWKERLLAQYAVAAGMPALDLDPLLDRGESALPQLAFRRVLVTCRNAGAKPEVRGGRSADGASGNSYFIRCRPGAEGLAGKLVVNAGWSASPLEDLRVSAAGVIAGRLGAGDGDRILLTSATAAPPLRPSAAPGIDQISNNHFLYALQWFFFAAAAAIVYLLALRKRHRG